MAKKENNKKEKAKKDADPYLIEIHSPNTKKMLSAARRYKKAQKVRLQALDEETTAKHEIVELAKKEKLKPMEDGTVKMSLEGVKISITPRDELVKVKFPESEDTD